MPGARRRTEGRTKVARLRQRRRMTQRQLSAASALSLSTVQRYERGDIDNPALRDLVALQWALGARTLRDVIEDEWLTPTPRERRG